MAIDSTIAAAATHTPTCVWTGRIFNWVCYKKKLFKILAVVAGIFLAALMYLEQQGIVNINWDKLNVTYHGVLSTVTNTITNSTVSGGIGGSHTAASSFLPVTTTTMTNLGIPLTGSMATGFAIGFMKGG